MTKVDRLIESEMVTFMASDFLSVDIDNNHFGGWDLVLRCKSGSRRVTGPDYARAQQSYNEIVTQIREWGEEP